MVKGKGASGYKVVHELLFYAQITLDKSNLTNRYFSVRRYGQYMNIAIFTSGDIDVTVNEACHIEHKQRVFEFTTDLYKQERFYDEFSTMLDWLLPLGFGESDIDMHTFMDYVEGSGDVIKAYESLMEDRKKYHDDY